MWIPKNDDFLPTNRFVKIVQEEWKDPKFVIYPKKDWEVDFENPIASWKEIEGKLVEVYTREKTSAKWAKYNVYWFTFDDEDWFFNFTLFEREMFSIINRLATCKTFNIKLNVFESVYVWEGKERSSRNFGIWEDWEKLVWKLTSEELKALVKETPNAAGKLEKDYSLKEETLYNMFYELQSKLKELRWTEDKKEAIVVEKAPVQEDDSDLPF